MWQDNTDTCKLSESIYKYLKEVEKPKRKIKEDVDDNKVAVFMNTWKNYNEYGADEGYNSTGWYAPEDAKKYAESYIDNEPFINDIENYPFNDINEYSSLNVLDDLVRYNQLSSEDKNVITALMESEFTNLHDAFDFFDNEEYTFLPDVKDEFDLGKYIIDNYGIDSINNIENYIDYDKYKDAKYYELRDKFVEMKQEENNDFQDEDVDEDELDEYIDECIENEAITDNSSVKDYIDYEALGDEMTNEGYAITSVGTIKTL